MNEKKKLTKNFYESAGDETLKYGVRTKLDLYTLQAFEEYANTYHNASLSQAVREFIKEGLIRASNENKLTATAKRKIMSANRRKRELDRKQLEMDYIDLQNNYDAEFEQVLIESAREKDFEYPPDVSRIELWQTDEELMKIIHSIKRTSNGRLGTTLREVYRNCNMPAAEALYHLKRLRDLEIVHFEDVPTGQQCIVTLRI